MDIAKLVTRHAQASIITKPSNDPRSYRVNSDKLLATGFRPKKTVEDAIREICEAYSLGKLKDEPQFHNLRWMQENVLTSSKPNALAPST
jgi:hypothetical protein